MEGLPEGAGPRGSGALESLGSFWEVLGGGTSLALACWSFSLVVLRAS